MKPQSKHGLNITLMHDDKTNHCIDDSDREFPTFKINWFHFTEKISG